MSASVAWPQRRCVLILDDEAAIRQLIRTAVQSSECDVLEFSDVAGAASALSTVTPDLIFLDLELGSGDAIEAFRAFADAGYSGTVQLMSGRGEHALDSVRAIGARYGFNLLAPISKPFRVKQIRQVVTDVLTSSTHAPSPAVLHSLPQAVAPSPSFSLNEALDQGWLELWYQPKVDLGTGKTVGGEGLIRARHPDHGMLPPSSFLPNATDQALLRLTERVILDALRDWQSMSDAGHPIQLCVNVPARALVDLPIAQILRQNRPRSADWPGLVLEITEDQIVDKLDAAQEVAAQLKIYNTALSIDDFGQGYSSLARLRDLPFEELKIDRSFVSGCDADSLKRDLCSAIINMAKGFGCRVIAEGIETAAELQVLQDLGCEYGQGYLLGRPMPKDNLIEGLGRTSPQWSADALRHAS
jgi:EAL domain-containing protein (putative c-di-GMP-specific phosphodiesterase class I)/CheY-like chemotaxis protein